MPDKKVEELGEVTEVYISGMCELDSGNRVPVKLNGVTLKKGDKIIKEDGVVKVAEKTKVKRQTASEKKAAAEAAKKKKEEDAKAAAEAATQSSTDSNIDESTELEESK